MKASILSVVLAALLMSSEVVAMTTTTSKKHKHHAVATSGSSASSTTLICKTSFGRKSRSTVPTHSTTKTSTMTVTVTSTVTPTKTITPAPVTTSVTNTRDVTTTTTLSQVTDTVTSTAISSTTTSVTQIITNTNTATTTLTTSVAGPTQTIAAPVNFVPIDQSVPDAETYNGKRSLEDTNDSTPVLAGGRKSRKHAHSVKCVEIDYVYATKTKTSTAAATSTTLNAATTGTTITTTVTVTDTTQSQDATSTISSTMTNINTVIVTQTITSTITSTSTSSIVAAPTLFYAQCADNNISPGYSGADFNVYGASGGGYSFQSGTADSPYDCCVQCATDVDCGGSAYSYGSSGFCGTVVVQQNGGILTPGKMCTAGTQPGNLLYRNDYTGDSGSDFAYFLSNGGCGEFDMLYPQAGGNGGNPGLPG